MALYDAIAHIYDPWSRSVTEDIDFYVEHAIASGGPVVDAEAVFFTGPKRVDV